MPRRLASRTLPYTFALLALWAQAHAVQVDPWRGTAMAPQTRSHKVPVQREMVAVDGRTNRVFVLARTGIRVFDAGSGMLQRTIAISPSIGGIAVDERMGRLFVTTMGSNQWAQGSISAIDEASGAVIRTAAVDVQPQAIALDGAAGRIFVASRWSVSVLSERTLSPLRTIPTVGFVSGPVAVDERRGLAAVASYAFTATGKPMLGANMVRLLDATSATVLHSIALPEGPEAVAVESRLGRVFAANADCSLIMLDERTGRLLRTTSLRPAMTCGALAVDGRTGRAFVLGYGVSGPGVETYDRFYLAVVDARTCSLLRMRRLDALPTAVVAAPGSGHVLVVLDTAVAVLDAADGRPVRMLTLGASIQGIALDASARRAYVAAGDAIRIIDTRAGV
ncbi:MAG TPA: hypothetical protein VFE42_30800 [Chloroflexota bacterium]|nr:hypothetical protein [Chloroflexota bacterium]